MSELRLVRTTDKHRFTDAKSKLSIVAFAFINYYCHRENMIDTSEPDHSRHNKGKAQFCFPKTTEDTEFIESTYYFVATIAVCAAAQRTIESI